MPDGRGDDVRRVYQGIADGASPDLPIGHGSTYSGHPVSAAVGLEVLRLYLDGGILENGRKVGRGFHAGLDAIWPTIPSSERRAAAGCSARSSLSRTRNKGAVRPALRLAARLFERGYAQWP